MKIKSCGREGCANVAVGSRRYCSPECQRREQNANRKARDRALRDLGLTKVKMRGETLWE